MIIEKKDFDFLPDMIKGIMEELYEKRENNEYEKRIFNIQQTSNELGKSYNFVVSLIKKGYLKTTKDSKHVSGKEINRYLGEHNNVGSSNSNEAA